MASPTEPPELPAFIRTMMNVPLFVGMVANSWARLEHLMVPLANKLLRTADSRVGKIVMFAANPVAKRDLILALTDISPLTEVQKQTISDWCTEYERLRILRNDVVHGRWDQLTKASTPVLRTAKSRASLKEKAEEKTVKWIMQIQIDIEELVSRSVKLAEEIAALRP
jgi:hypothetical protein